MKSQIIYDISIFFVLVLMLSGKNFAQSGIDTLNIKIMVPAYFDPSSSTYWDSLKVQSSKFPDRIYAIANPSSGPGKSFNSAYAAVIDSMHGNSGHVIGYVWTNYGRTTINKVESLIDTWYSFYPTIDGIFFDGMASSSGKESFYQTLYNYVKQKNSAALVVGNPGTNTLETYLYYNGSRVADVLCIFETTGFNTWVPSSWCSNYSRTNFYAIPYDIPDTEWVSTVDRASSLNIGWIYVTDANTPNPYNTLPSYFDEECSYVATGIISKKAIFIKNDNVVPIVFSLSSNYPNPFNPSTNIKFSLAEAGNVSLKVYNVMGELVKTIVDNVHKDKGDYTYNINMDNLSSGIYVYTLTQNNQVITKKMVLLK